MKKLLKFEFYKLLRSKTFYIMGAIMLVLSTLGLMLNFLIYEELLMEECLPSSLDFMITALSDASLSTLVGIFIVIFVCDDYNQKTIKNIHARGFSRNQVFFSKLLVCLCGVFVLYFINLVFNFLGGAILFDFQFLTLDCLLPLLGQLFYCVAYTSLSFMFAMLFRSIGAGIALCIVTPTVLSILLALVDMGISWSMDFETISTYATDFWLDSFLGSVTSVATSHTRLWTCIGLSTAYALLFLLFGWLAQRKKDC